MVGRSLLTGFWHNSGIAREYVRPGQSSKLNKERALSIPPCSTSTQCKQLVSVSESISENPHSAANTTPSQGSVLSAEVGWATLTIGWATLTIGWASCCFTMLAIGPYWSGYHSPHSPRLLTCWSLLNKPEGFHGLLACAKIYVTYHTNAVQLKYLHYDTTLHTVARWCHNASKNLHHSSDLMANLQYKSDVSLFSWGNIISL